MPTKHGDPAAGRCSEAIHDQPPASVPADQAAQDTTTQLGRWPVALGSTFAPNRIRRGWLIVVTDCPYCGRRHTHLVDDLAQAAGARRARCGGVYWVALNDVHPPQPAVPR